MKIAGRWIRAAGVQTILGLLETGGHRAYLVGGCVRNDLLGRPVADIDIATDATPDRVAALAAEAGITAVPTGIEHGTLTLVIGGIPHEVTTFRRDVATDGRRARVSYAAGLAEDAARRDFTMNALYADASGQILDPIGGLPDLRARRVRFVGDPGARVREDYLRILRFFRFHAHYGDPEQGLDAEALAACAAHLDGLRALSRERVGHELRRLLGAPDPAPAVAAMAKSGVLARVLPGADPRFLAPLVDLEAELMPDWRRRLAVLGGPDPTEGLRLSRSESRDLAALRDGLSSAMAAGELGYRYGADVARDILLLRAATGGGRLPAGWEQTVQHGAAARFPVSARDLTPALSGPELGARLRDIEARWIASGFELSREQLLS